MNEIPSQNQLAIFLQFSRVWFSLSADAGAMAKTKSSSARKTKMMQSGTKKKKRGRPPKSATKSEVLEEISGIEPIQFFDSADSGSDELEKKENLKESSIQEGSKVGIKEYVAEIRLNQA